MAGHFKIRLAVLTSGGDSAGMNAVVRAVVKAGILKYVSAHFRLWCNNNELHIEAVKPTSFVKVTKVLYAEMQKVIIPNPQLLSSLVM